MMSYSTVVLILALLIILTNIIVQLIKDVVGLKDQPTKVVTTFVAIFLTVGSTVAYCQIHLISVTWYLFLASFIIGIVVAYGAIFGFDNLYGELLDKTKELFIKGGKK